MPRGKKTTKIETTAESYDHKQETTLRPDIGLQAQFKQKREPKKYRYDSSLSPELSWDINAERERAEAMIAKIREAKTLEEAKSAADTLAHLSKPFLNWTGKAERGEFTVPTLPLFVHERLSTKAILESLKHRKQDKTQQMTLFGDVELDLTDRILRAYEHKTPWVNRIILGDSLVVMNSLLGYEGMGGKVQMIYMDPPYGVKFGSNFQPFIRKRDVKHGDDQFMTREPEMVQAYRDTWEIGIHSYLTYLRDRFFIARELLTESGSIFVQIGDENVHHVKELMDEVFGEINFISVITFKKTTGLTAKLLTCVSDFIIWYAKDINHVKYNQVFSSKIIGGEGATHYNKVMHPDGSTRPISKEEAVDQSILPKGCRIYEPSPMISQGNPLFAYEFQGKLFSGTYKTTKEGLDNLAKANRLEIMGNLLRYRRFFDDYPVYPITNVWEDILGIQSRSDPKIYVVQTSTTAIQRCLLMTTDPGDLVLDPTCGSGTTSYVAEQWGRRWITIDTSRVPLALARQRLLTATFDYYELRDAAKGPAGGFVYKRKQNSKGEEVGGIVPHITLKSIAQNEPPAEEILVDRPEIVSGIVRVSGPFAVEGTIPPPMEIDEPETVKTIEAHSDYSGDYITRMIEILRRAPMLRLPGNKTVNFKNIRRPARSMDIHAEGMVTNGEEKTVAFVFGPENGAVTEQMVFAAAREAYAKSFTHLFVIGFSAHANATKFIQNCAVTIGIPATYVNATMDILMGDLLKTSRASQIFSVTGQPEIRVLNLEKGAEALYQVELLGLDVFKPDTMETDHMKGELVPAWFLDTDYNELAFHVSQAFFPRTSAWDNLKRALKSTYDDSVWEHLAGTTSEPFEAGENRRIAVKVIDDRGNELMVVKNLEEVK
jgi:adenine-specific DNA-methyltransferase